jgi:hypothetical protein
LLFSYNTKTPPKTLFFAVSLRQILFHDKYLQLCPCLYGYDGVMLKPCMCSPAVVTKYQKNISGPVLDRIDIHIEMLNVDYEKLSGERTGESNGSICMRVQAARDIQLIRPKTRLTPHTVLTDIMMAQGCLRETGRTYLQLLEYGAEQVGSDAKESVAPLHNCRLALTNTHA